MKKNERRKKANHEIMINYHMLRKWDEKEERRKARPQAVAIETRSVRLLLTR